MCKNRYAVYLQLWQLSSGQLLRTLSSQSHWVLSLIFSSCDKQTVPTYRYKLFLFTSIAAVSRCGPSPARVTGFSASSSPPVISRLSPPTGISCCSSHLWQLSSGQLLHTLSSQCHWVLSPIFSSCDKQTVPHLQVRGVLGNKCAGPHNLKTVQIREIMWKENIWRILFCT